MLWAKFPLHLCTENLFAGTWELTCQLKPMVYLDSILSVLINSHSFPQKFLIQKLNFIFNHVDNIQTRPLIPESNLTCVLQHLTYGS